MFLYFSFDVLDLVHPILYRVVYDVVGCSFFTPITTNDRCYRNLSPLVQ